MITLFASEYVRASFDEVCAVLRDVAGDEDLGVRPGPIRRGSSAVASMDLQFAEPSSGAGWQAAELRVIRVQSGAHPLTELLLVVPASAVAAGPRAFLERVAQRIESGAPEIAGAGR